MTLPPQPEYIITEDKLVKLQGVFHKQNMKDFFDIINEVFDSPYQSSRDTVLDEIEELAEHYYRAYLDGDPYIEKTDFKKMITELHQTKAGE